MLARVLHDLRSGIAACEDRGRSPEVLRELDREKNSLPFDGRQPLQRRRLDVDRRPFDAELSCEPCRVAHDVLVARIGADAAQQRILGLPDALDRLVGAIRSHVVFDAVGGAAKRELAQRHQVALAEEVRRRPLDLLGHVHLACRQPCEQIVGRHVDHHDLVRLVEERIGHGLPHVDARDAAYDVVQALDVLHVERAEHVDTGGQQLVDVLPPLGMTRPWNVGVRELVDEDQRGPAGEGGVEVELGQLVALIVEHLSGKNRKPREQRLGFLAAVRLEEAYHDVLALVAQRARRGEHRVGLANPCGSAEINAKAAAKCGRVLSLDLRKELVGIRPV